MDNKELEKQVFEPLAFLLAPIRALLGIWAWSALLAALAIVCLWNNTMWVYGLGSKGYLSLMESKHDAEKIMTSKDGRDEWGTMLVDFRHREAPLTYEQAIDPNNESYRRKGFTSTLIEGNQSFDLPFCDRDANDSPTLATEPGSWWERDADQMLRRKSARMRRDYIQAAIMISTLRATITYAALGIPLPEREVARVGIDKSFCNADPLNRSTSRVNYILYSSFSNQVSLPDAPVVWVRMLDLSHTRATITGMCIENQCGPDDLNYYVAGVADLFSQTPPLAPEQVKAEMALQQTGDPDFWMKEAAVNHVTDREKIMAGFQIAKDSVEWVTHKWDTAPPVDTETVDTGRMVD